MAFKLLSVLGLARRATDNGQPVPPTPAKPLQDRVLTYAIENRTKTPGEDIGEKVGVLIGKTASASTTFFGMFVRNLRTELADAAEHAERQEHIALYDQLTEKIHATDLNRPATLYEAKQGAPTFSFTGDDRNRRYVASMRETTGREASVTVETAGRVDTQKLETLLDAYAIVLLDDIREKNAARVITRTANDNLPGVGPVKHTLTYDGHRLESTLDWSGGFPLLGRSQRITIAYTDSRGDR